MAINDIMTILTVSLLIYVATKVAFWVKPAHALIAFAVVMLLSTPIWMIYAETNIFNWLKIYTIGITACLIFMASIVSDYWKKKIFLVLYLVVAANIAELVAVEFINTGDMINPIAGLLLIISLPLTSAFHLDDRSSYLLYDIDWLYILAYSIWNLIGIYNLTSGSTTVYSLIHLGIPILMMAGRTGLYLQYRVVVLFLFMIYWMYAHIFPLKIEAPYIYNAGVSNWTPRKTSPFGEEFDSVGALICGE